MKPSQFTVSSAAILLGLGVAAGSQAQVLEEVVVTAQKREQQAQDVGISITAYSGDQIDALGYTNAQQVAAMAPGVSTVQPNGEANYALGIRGAVNSDFTANQESPISIYVDEVYISQMSGAGFMLFDLERVELLRGPQGTLFGRNATGGLAHFITRKPKQERDAYGQFTFGEYDQVKFQGAIGGGLSENVSARFSVATHHNSGYVNNRLSGDDLNNANDYAGRVQLLWEPNEQSEFLFNARYSLQQIRTGFFENKSSRPFGPGGTGVLTPGQGNFNGYEDNDGDVYAGDYDKRGHNDLETYGFSGTFKYDFGMFDFTSITDYQAVKRDYIEDSDASPFNDFNFFLSTDSVQWSQEARLHGQTDKLDWVAGFYYLDIEFSDAVGAEVPLQGLLPAPALTDGAGTNFGYDNPYTQEKDSWSIFGQLEYSFTDQWKGIAGLRWIEENVDHRYQDNFVAFQDFDGSKNRNGNPNVIAQLVPQGEYRGSYDAGLWAARVEIDFQWSDDLLLYASWNRGVKGGGFNAPLFTDVEPFLTDGVTHDNMKFNEEELNAYEIGFKSSLWDGLARFNVSGFYNDYDDTYQAFTIIGLSTLLQNSEADAKGFEMEFIANPLQGMDFVAGLGYIDMDVTLPDGFKTTPVQTPELNVNGLIRYAYPAYNGEIAVQADFEYQSKKYFAMTKASSIKEGGYVVGNVRVSYTTEDRDWEAAFFVNNVADEEYLVAGFDVSGDFGWTEHYYGRPRWIGGSIRYNWD